MNIKVAAFTVSEKPINTKHSVVHRIYARIGSTYLVCYITLFYQTLLAIMVLKSPYLCSNLNGTQC